MSPGGALSRPSKLPVRDREPRLKNNRHSSGEECRLLRTSRLELSYLILGPASQRLRLLSSTHTPGAISGVSYPLRLSFIVAVATFAERQFG